jgi:hypothetical protein
LLDGLLARNMTLETAVLLPGGGPIARGVAVLASRRRRFGAFIVAAGDVGISRAPSSDRAYGPS